MKHNSQARKALEEFLASQPEVMDYLNPFTGNVNNFVDWETSVYDSSAQGEPDAPWTKECPDHDHDCSREGCGRTVSPNWYVWGSLSARLIGSRKRVVLAEWINHYQGGYGI